MYVQTPQGLGCPQKRGADFHKRVPLQKVDARRFRFPNQKPTFREAEKRRGIEYCPCTIVLSLESR
jgi:hypothetical protein